MIDKIILFPYYLTLKIRHALYDKGVKKSCKADIPTVCVGNVTVGGTGKTPHTEMILNVLLGSDDWGMKDIAVLSRGYKRGSNGFQQVLATDGAGFSGDEPAQIKKNYPGITVAVCKDRIQGLDLLAHPDKLKTDKAGKRCIHKDFAPAQVVVLDDAFQYRKLKPTVSIVLEDYNRPVTKDRLLPFGRLRDLGERLQHADILIVTKCPVVLEDWEKLSYLKQSGVTDYDFDTCTGTFRNGRKVKIFFTSINYQPLKPVFVDDADIRYSYSSRTVVFTGIANDTPLLRYLSDSFKISSHFSFADHKKFSRADIHRICSASSANPTAAILTTEKDAMRILDCKWVPEELKKKLFYLPIKVFFLSEKEEALFTNSLLESLRKSS